MPELFDQTLDIMFKLPNKPVALAGLSFYAQPKVKAPMVVIIIRVPVVRKLDELDSVSQN